MSEKLIAIIGVGVICALFIGIIIYSELVTDEKRFLITNLGSLNQTVLGQPLEDVASLPEINVQFIEILPNAQSGWHTVDSPIIVTVLHGTLKIEYCYEDVKSIDQCIEPIIKHYETGDVFVEAINIPHNAMNEGVIPVKIHIVILNSGRD